ncbi:MAG: TIGR03663 family protein [Archaeoglobaceae archaeon]
MNRKILVIILVIAIATRIAFLDARPMDHDESIHAYLSYNLLNYNQYSYDPAFHGPFLYFASAGIFGVLGDSEFTARLAPVIFSVIGVFAACLFDRWFGKGAYIFAFLMVFSPSILYYSRYMRNDMILVGSFLVAVYCYFRYVSNEKEYLAYIAAVFVGVMLTAKENAYIYMFILVSFILLYGLYYKRLNYLSILIRWDWKKLRMVVISSLIVGSIFVSLYTAGFGDYGGLEDATVEAFSHWFTMHAEEDHAKQLWYYGNILLQYEFLPLALSIVSIPVFYRRLRKGESTKIEMFAAYWLFMSVLGYHVLSHKVPWLLVHLVAPLAFFGAIYSGSVFSWNRRAYRLAFVLIVAVTLVISLNITYVDYNNAEEDLIYIQAQHSTVELANVIEQKYNAGEEIAVYEPNNDYWPLPWYLREIDIGFYSSKWVEGIDYVVTSQDQKSFVEDKGYEVVNEYEMRPNLYMYLMKQQSSN